MLDGRAAPDTSDFFILRHIWNNLDQAEILDGIVGPVLEAHYREHPEARRFGAADVGIDALIAEINRIRELLTGDRPLSDIQLFSQLKALNEIKAALAGDRHPAGARGDRAGRSAARSRLPERQVFPVRRDPFRAKTRRAPRGFAFAPWRLCAKSIV